MHEVFDANTPGQGRIPGFCDQLQEAPWWTPIAKNVG